MQNFAVTKVQWPYFLWVQIVRLLGTAPGIPVLQCKLLKEKRFLGSSYIGAGCGERGHTNLMIGSWFEQQTPKWGNLKRDSCVCVCVCGGFFDSGFPSRRDLAWPEKEERRKHRAEKTRICNPWRFDDSTTTMQTRRTNQKDIEKIEARERRKREERKEDRKIPLENAAKLFRLSWTN